MNRSEQVNELVTALAKAQLEFLPIEKEVENPFYKRKYAVSFRSSLRQPGRL